MKKFALAAAFAAVASTSFAGNPAPVTMDPVVVVEETSSSSAGGIVVPLLLLVLLVAATR